MEMPFTVVCVTAPYIYVKTGDPANFKIKAILGQIIHIMLRHQKDHLHTLRVEFDA